MQAVNKDAEVMRFFPNTLSLEQTQEFIKKMQQQFQKNGFCYYAVEKLEDEQFIGFIGLSEKDFKADFTPCIDICWRLHQSNWNKGYATEGALACLNFGFEVLKLKNIKSITPVINLPSEHVMKKIGMYKVGTFKNLLLGDYPDLEEYLLYEINHPNMPLYK
jgi:RimJ/RimL family protein N-acetyltransferase